MTTRKRACTGKVRFSTRKAAKLARRRMRGAGVATSGHLAPYCCDFCGFWHLGHLSPSVFRGVLDKDDWRAS